MGSDGVFACLLTSWYRLPPSPLIFWNQWITARTVAKIFDFKGLTAKILKARELAPGLAVARPLQAIFYRYIIAMRLRDVKRRHLVVSLHYAGCYRARWFRQR